jgi:hypothetical protein
MGQENKYLKKQSLCTPGQWVMAFSIMGEKGECNVKLLLYMQTIIFQM